MKKTKKVLITLIVLVILLIIGFLTYNYFFKNNENKEVKVVKEISGYGYSLKENASDLYKDEFDKLDKILSNSNVDYENYAKSVAKLFIIDFYTLDNKLSKNDIGGTEFIKDSMKDNFIDQARSTFYKYLEVKTSKRKQELPKVSKINDVSLENTSFVIKDIKTTTSSSKKRVTTSKGTTVDAYKITISWDYEKDLGYEKEAKMIIIKENKKLYIVEMN
ncbi:MAG: hypothetical protein IJ094_09890 [Bacilli bacterium]|nr:hypothetical protein [Bacilli bacterium]